MIFQFRFRFHCSRLWIGFESFLRQNDRQNIETLKFNLGLFLPAAKHNDHRVVLSHFRIEMPVVNFPFLVALSRGNVYLCHVAA